LSSFRDGWRHLRYLLVHSPLYLFIIPGALMALVGVLATITVLANINVLGRHWDLHTLIAGSLLIIVGVQVFAMGLCAQAYAKYYLGHRDRWFDVVRAHLKLEHGLALGVLLASVGLLTGGIVVIRWIERGFGALAEERLALVAATFVIIGLQTFFTSFLLSILGLRRSDNP
jgi:hypothetical protein